MLDYKKLDKEFTARLNQFTKEDLYNWYAKDKHMEKLGIDGLEIKVVKTTTYVFSESQGPMGEDWCQHVIEVDNETLSSNRDLSESDLKFIVMVFSNALKRKLTESKENNHL